MPLTTTSNTVRDMGQALETVTVQHHRANAPHQVRISGRVKRAIDLMVMECQKRPDAAKGAGITDDAMRKAMLKPEVIAYLNTQQQVLRTSAAARSIARVDKLADDSESDHVKLQSNVFLLGIEGIAPTQRIENTHIHRNTQPGLTLNFIMGSEARVIDSQAHQVEDAKVISDLPQSVPHPSMRNATIQPVETTPAPVPPGGQKP